MENRRREESNNLVASGGKKIEDLLNGVVGAVVGGFKFAGRLASGGGTVMVTAVGTEVRLTPAGVVSGFFL